MGSLLDGWTFDDGADIAGFGDYGIFERLQSYGAIAAPDNSVSDVWADSAHSKGGEFLLRITYRGRVQYIRGNLDFDAKFAKIVLDMAIIRLTEKRKEIDKKLGR